MTKKVNKGELTIMLIVVILMATVFFCYSLMQLCILVVRGDRTRAHYGAAQLGPGGYVVPSQPIRVVMAQDEEAAGAEHVAAKITPPAYGLWRESVVSAYLPTSAAGKRSQRTATDKNIETAGGPRPPLLAAQRGGFRDGEHAAAAGDARGTAAAVVRVRRRRVVRGGGNAAVDGAEGGGFDADADAAAPV